MPDRLSACEAASEIVRITGRGSSRKGFDEYQVLLALKYMSRGPMGRPTLERLVGVGEASAKTMLRSLREAGLISRCGAAHCTTDRGAAIADSLQGLCLAGPGDTGLDGELSKVIVVFATIVEPPTDIVDVHRIRDYLVARSCKPAVIGAYWPPDIFRFPGVPIDVERALSESIIRIIKGSPCASSIDNISTVVVAPATCGTKAGAALVELIADYCGLH